MGRVTARGGGFMSFLLVSVLLAWAQADVRQPPKITSPITAVSRFAGEKDRVVLECVASGQPKPEYKWTWNGGEIVESDRVTYDSDSGKLIIKSLDKQDEGFYKCQATVTFYRGMYAAAVSPQIEVRMARIGSWNKSPDRQVNTTEGAYMALKCEENMPVNYGPTNFKWYIRGKSQNMDEIKQDDRIFIDAKGFLRFAYVLKSDNLDGQFYSCAMSSARAGQIHLGGFIELNVLPGKVSVSPPVLKFYTGMDNPTNLHFLRNNVGRLECFFSGYPLPAIQWSTNDGTLITTSGRYYVENFDRVLRIEHITEDDQEPIWCKAVDPEGRSEKEYMTPKVISAPIWIKPLHSQTVPEGNNVIFTCESRSLKGDPEPGLPIWYRNGITFGNKQSANKYKFSNNDRSLEVIGVQKNTDIACYQCVVNNIIGQSYSDGCLNVLIPIKITQRPPEEQTIERGDIVALTVNATADELVSITYKWIFNNVSYLGINAPPYVTYDPVTRVAFINTTHLNDDEMKEIRGVYECQVFHAYETKSVFTEVVVEDAPIVVPVKVAGFDYWIIGLIIGILLIIIVILLICCVICRRKMLEGDYPVDRKETAAGLDPQKELKDSGFHDLSRADYDFMPDKKQPNLDFDEQIPLGDDDSFGSEYGDDEGTAFNEDGSFIGIYAKGKKGGPPGYNNAAESNV